MGKRKYRFHLFRKQRRKSPTPEIATRYSSRLRYGLFTKPLSISSCVKTYETCEGELWWLLLLADNFRRQNVEVQCFVVVSLSHDKKMKKRRDPAQKNFDIQKLSRKSNSNCLYDRVKAPLTSSVYHYNHLSPLPA